MTTYSFDTQHVPAWVEAKITDIQWQEVFNSLSPEILKELEDHWEIVSTTIEAKPEAFQHPKTWEIFDDQWNKLSHTQAQTIWYIHTLNGKAADEVIKNLRIIKK